MKNLIILFLLACLGFLTAINYHFILYDDNITVLRKVDMTMEHTFVDARGNNAMKVLLMPDLVAAGIQSKLNGKGKNLNLNIHF